MADKNNIDPKIDPNSSKPSKAKKKDYYERLAQIESGGNPNAKAGTSTASGLYQFTESTWKGLVKQLDLDYTLDDRFDPEKSKEVVKQFTNDNKRYLESKLGRDVNEGELYLAHFLGRGGALKFISKVDNAQNVSAADLVSERAIKANAPVFLNKDGSVKSAMDIYNWANKKMGTGVSKQPIAKDAVSVNPSTITNNFDAFSQDTEKRMLAANESQGLSPSTLNGLNLGSTMVPFDDLSVLPGGKKSQPKEGQPAFGSGHGLLDNEGLASTSAIRSYNDGGSLSILGGNEESLTEFNEGGTHETSPHGGIPISRNEKGGLNLVEEGETKFNDYILSNSLYVTPEDAENYNINDDYIGLSFAEASKKINEQIKERPFDKRTVKTAEGQLASLTYANEEKRVAKEAKKNTNFNQGGGLSSGCGGPGQPPCRPTVDQSGIDGVNQYVEKLNKEIAPTKPTIPGKKGKFTILDQNLYDSFPQLEYSQNPGAMTRALGSMLLGIKSYSDDEVKEFGPNSGFGSDLFKKALGYQGNYKHISDSEYKPTKAKNKNINYVKINDLDKDAFLELGLQELGNKYNTTGDENSKVVNNIGMPSHGLANYTLSKGEDENGRYLSYYDKYDFGNELANKYLDETPEIYDRIYYEDNPYFKQIKDIQKKQDSVFGLDKSKERRKQLDSLYKVKSKVFEEAWENEYNVKDSLVIKREDGGPVDPKKGITPTAASTMNDSKEFTKNWFNDSETKARLSMNLGQNIGKSMGMVNEGLQNIDNTQVQQFPKGNQPVGGMYANNTIDVYGEPTKEVGVHEYTHAMKTVDNPLSNYIKDNWGSPAQAIQKKTGLPFKEAMGQAHGIQDKDTLMGQDKLNNAIEHSRYMTNDGELYPRFMEMRATLGVKPGEVIEDSHIERLKAQKDVNPMFKYYDTKQIKDILNTVASNENTPTDTVAKHGGHMKSKKKNYNNFYFLGGEEGDGMTGDQFGTAAGGALQLGAQAFGKPQLDANGQKTQSMGGGIASGALKGAAAGAALGPIGAGVGAVVGIGAGIIGGSAAEKAEQEYRRNQGLMNNAEFSSTFHDGGKAGHVHNSDELGAWAQPFTPEAARTGGLYTDPQGPSNPNAVGVPKHLQQGMYTSPTGPTTDSFSILDPSLLPTQQSPVSLEGVPGTIQSPQTTSVSDAPSATSATTNPSDNVAQTTNPEWKFNTDEYNRRMDEYESILSKPADKSLFVEDAAFMKDLKDKTSALDDDKENKFDFKELLRYAPAAGNLGQLLFGDNSPEVTSLDRMDNRYNPSFVDENSLLNTVKGASANTKAAIQQNAAGSASAARSGLLAAQVNEVKALSDAMFQASGVNRGERATEQDFNSRIDQVNLGQSNQEKQINAQNRGAAASRKAQLFDSFLGSVGDIGKEQKLSDMLAQTLGYNPDGKKVDTSAKNGGKFTSAFAKREDSVEEKLKELMRRNYGY